MSAHLTRLFGAILLVLLTGCGRSTRHVLAGASLLIKHARLTTLSGHHLLLHLLSVGLLLCRVLELTLHSAEAWLLVEAAGSLHLLAAELVTLHHVLLHLLHARIVSAGSLRHLSLLVCVHFLR